MKRFEIVGLCGICLKLAELIDRRTDEQNQNDKILNDLGLGCRAFTSYLRNGVKGIVDLQNDYTRALDKAQYAKISENQARDMLEDIFGDREADSLNDELKEKIKTYVSELLKEYESEGN